MELKVAITPENKIALKRKDELKSRDTFLHQCHQLMSDMFKLAQPFDKSRDSCCQNASEDEEVISLVFQLFRFLLSSQEWCLDRKSEFCQQQ